MELMKLERFDAVTKLEEVLMSLSINSGDPEYKKAKVQIREIFQSFGKLENDRNKTLAETITDLKKSGPRGIHRDCAMMMIRALSVQNLLSSKGDSTKIQTHLIQFVEANLPDIYKRFDIDKKSQTYEKIEILETVHRYCCDKLNCLSDTPSKIETIAAERGSILRSIGDSTVKAYLTAYEFNRIRSSIEAILTQVIALSESVDSGFTHKYKDLTDLLQDEISYCRKTNSFLINDYYLPFLYSVTEAAEAVVKRAREQFICKIESSKGHTFKLEKKYPLQEKHGEIGLVIPFNNTGPGIADRTTVHISTKDKNTLILTEEVELGGVNPGAFVVPVTFTVATDIEKLVLDVLVEWRVIGEANEKIEEFRISIEAQAENVNWESLSTLNPYSLGIATGADFYGRRDKLNRLIKQVSQGRMQSSYITGQRRVGKSSLAKAVEDKIQNDMENCFVMNIECGDFKHPDSSKTIELLGEQIEDFLQPHLPSTTIWPKANMLGTLAPITKLVNLLSKTSPEKRFLIIIDEFDEINQELYRYSEIAETFFLNLRSLSGKPNLCFILVGAEKMSFVMQSQGEKLNRFSRESLDSFHQEDEWKDYESLVKSATGESIKWLHSAIRYVYSITNGHPYFTKQLCSRVFERAISIRDAEISNEEIEVSVNQLVAELEVNAFQHYWRDGIQGDADDIEISSIKRCRVLIGYARVLRKQKETNLENVESHMNSSQLDKLEIPGILRDFCRRDIMVEMDGIFSIVNPLFEKWLVNSGFKNLIADRFGDELAEKKQALEDAAYVNDEELTELVTRWPTYHGTNFNHHILRDWISQSPSLIKQRLLFKLLKNTRFYGEKEIRDGLKSLYGKIQSDLPILVSKSKAERRKDLWITYLDGAGKSGAHIAGLYSDVNKISNTCVKEIADLDNIFQNKPASLNDLGGIILIDDFIGTGTTLVNSLDDFYSKNGEYLTENKVPVYLLSYAATKQGEDKVRNKLAKLDANADMLVQESLEIQHHAFSSENSIWDDQNELQKAKDLCQSIGIDIDRRRPLGYGEQALLVVFPRNCPNNTLPIFHSRGRGESNWKPLFERIKK